MGLRSRSRRYTHKQKITSPKQTCDGYLGGATRTLLPALRYHGISIPEGHRIAVEEVTLPSEKIKIDQVLLQSGVRLTKEYLENTYGVQVEESVPEPVTQKKSPTTQNSAVNSELIALYTATDLALQDDTPSFVVPIEAWLRKIFAGTQKTIDSKSAQAVMRYLIQAV